MTCTPASAKGTLACSGEGIELFGFQIAMCYNVGMRELIIGFVLSSLCFIALALVTQICVAILHLFQKLVGLPQWPEEGWEKGKKKD